MTTKDSKYGNAVIIKTTGPNGDYYTLYAHQNGVGMPSVGTHVISGQTIGQVGTTGDAKGAHLHYEVITQASMTATGSAINNRNSNPAFPTATGIQPNTVRENPTTYNNYAGGSAYNYNNPLTDRTVNHSIQMDPNGSGYAIVSTTTNVNGSNVVTTRLIDHTGKGIIAQNHGDSPITFDQNGNAQITRNDGSLFYQPLNKPIGVSNVNPTFIGGSLPNGERVISITSDGFVGGASILTVLSTNGVQTRNILVGADGRELMSANFGDGSMQFVGIGVAKYTGANGGGHYFDTCTGQYISMLSNGSGSLFNSYGTNLLTFNNGGLVNNHNGTITINTPNSTYKGGYVFGVATNIVSVNTNTGFGVSPLPTQNQNDSLLAVNGGIALYSTTYSVGFSGTNYLNATNPTGLAIGGITTNYSRPGAIQLAPSLELSTPFQLTNGGLTITNQAIGNNKIVNATQITYIDPLVLDLNGDGVKMTDYATNPVLFDTNHSGSLHQTGWISATDGILVADTNNSTTHRIDISQTISEYYGGQVGRNGEAGTKGRDANGKAFTNGFDALKTFDANKDGVFDNKDSAWANLRVWVDANHDGIVNVGNDALTAVSKGNNIDNTGSWLVGGGGSNTYNGGTGNDVFIISANDKSSNIHGGGGTDMVVVVGSKGVTLNLSQAQITIAEGGVGDDTIIGGGRATVFVAGGKAANDNSCVRLAAVV